MTAEKPKILIVDDRIENLVALERTLEELNLEFVRATSGNEAVFKAMENKFALILIDVQMPEMDGFEAVEYIRKEPQNLHIPIIFISAIYRDDVYKVKGFKAGAVDFITKPINESVPVSYTHLTLPTT